MDSRLIFLPRVMIVAYVRFSKLQPTIRREGSRKGEADSLPKCREEEPRKAYAVYWHVRTKTDTGR